MVAPGENPEGRVCADEAGMTMHQSARSAQSHAVAKTRRPKPVGELRGISIG